MASKKARAYFICPQWNDVAGTSTAGKTPPKVLAQIAAGKPVARSALRRALLAASLDQGKPIDVDAYIVDQRTGPHSTAPRAAG